MPSRPIVAAIRHSGLLNCTTAKILWKIDMALESIINATKSVLRDALSPSLNNLASDRDEVLQDLHLAEKAWATDGVRSGTWLSVTASM
jgi:hypothetical protein